MLNVPFCCGLFVSENEEDDWERGRVSKTCVRDLDDDYRALLLFSSERW